MLRIRRCGRIELSLAAFLMVLLALQVGAQEYLVGPDDVVRITFWQQPDLNTTSRVRQDGKISLPVLGEIEAAGLSLRELEENIVKGISVYNREISQARVEIVEYNSRKVFISGEVYRPGKYAFEFIPNLWEVLREAGGPTEQAVLTNVTVVRGGEEVGKKISVDLAQVLETGDFSKLPELKPGDTVIIPSFRLEGGRASADLLGRSVVFIYGQIAHPGVYPINEESTLLQAITMAGGPTSAADLKDVRVIMKHGLQSTVAKVNVGKHLSQGSPRDFPLRPGDTVVIPKRAGIWRSIWRGTTGVIAATSTVLGLLYVVDRLRD